MCYNRIMLPFILSNSGYYKMYIQSKVINYDLVTPGNRTLRTNLNTLRKLSDFNFSFRISIKSVRKL